MQRKLILNLNRTRHLADRTRPLLYVNREAAVVLPTLEVYFCLEFIKAMSA